MELKDKPLIAILLIGFVPSISVIFGIKIIEDEFYSQEDIQSYRKELNNFKSEWISYNGGHTIDTKTLKLFEN